MVVKAQYIGSMQVDTNWYWNQHPKQHIITLPTRTILHTRLEVNVVTYFHSIPKSLCNREKTKKSISINPISLTESDYNYMLEENGCQDKIEFERDVEVYSDDEGN